MTCCRIDAVSAKRKDPELVSEVARFLVETCVYLFAGGGEPGTWASAGQDVPMAESPSLNSITSQEARAVLTKPSSSELPPCDDDSAKEPAATAAAVEGQQHILLGYRSSDEAPLSDAQQQDEGGKAEGNRQQLPSNESAESHQERGLDQGGLGQCGSYDHCFAYGENTLEEGVPDSGSDSGDMSAKGGKRSRSDFAFAWPNLMLTHF